MAVRHAFEQQRFRAAVAEALGDFQGADAVADGPKSTDLSDLRFHAIADGLASKHAVAGFNTLYVAAAGLTARNIRLLWRPRLSVREGRRRRPGGHAGGRPPIE
jgi:hypothetical protein